MATRTIYVVGVTDNPIKVGLTSNMAERLSTLQVACPDPLICHYQFRVHHLVAADAEREVHAALKDHHRSGEWFNVSAERAADVIRRVASKLTTEYSDRIGRSRAADPIEVLGSKFDLNPWAAEAVAYYRVQAAKGAEGKASVEKMNRVILDGAGVLGLQVFKMVTVGRTHLGSALHRDPGAQRKADRLQAAAINALGRWFAEARQKILLDQIIGNAA